MSLTCATIYIYTLAIYTNNIKIVNGIDSVLYRFKIGTLCNTNLVQYTALFNVYGLFTSL